MEKSPNSSPEFEFWMSSNNNNNNPPSSSFSHPENLLSADELFSDGVILPLNTHPPPPRAGPTTTTTNPPPPPAPPTISSSPKRWKLMFRPSSSKEAKRTNGANNMELNIHIWPFSRSRSSGNTASSSTGGTANPVRGAPGRKSCSAPCSRSNSRGDSETATAATSSAAKPATGAAAATPLKKRGQLAGGIYIGRSVPVWQLRGKNHGNNNNNGRGAKKVNVGINMLNLKNVNTCIGYGSNNANGPVSGCRVEDKDEVAEGDRSGGEVIRGGSLLKFRAIFSKKVHV